MLFGKKKKDTTEEVYIRRKGPKPITPKYYEDAYKEYLKILNYTQEDMDKKYIPEWQIGSKLDGWAYNLHMDLEGNTNNIDIINNEYEIETVEAYKRRLEITEEVHFMWAEVFRKEGNDKSLNLVQKIIHRSHFEHLRKVAEEERLTDADYEVIRQSIRDFYKMYKGENHCIISNDYIIDAWLTLAQHVYYDNPKKIVEDDVKVVNYYLDDLKMKVKLASNNTLKYKDDDNLELFPDFELKRLDPEDEEYKKQLEEYVEKHYGYSLQKFDATFSLGTAKMIINDAINNGIDHNLVTYDVQEKELMEILNIRDTRKITREQFLKLSDYGKELTVREAIINNVGVYVYPSPLKINEVKLNKDLDGLAKYMAAKHLRFNGVDILKNNDYGVPTKDTEKYEYLKDAKDPAYVKSQTRLLSDRYPLYYYDENNKAKKLNSYIKQLPDEYDIASYGDQIRFKGNNNIISLKEIDYRILSTGIVIGMRNIKGRQPYSRDENGRLQPEVKYRDADSVVAQADSYVPHPGNEGINVDNGTFVPLNEPDIFYVSYSPTYKKEMGHYLYDEGVVKNMSIDGHFTNSYGSRLNKDNMDIYRKFEGEEGGEDYRLTYSTTIRNCINELCMPFSISQYINDSDELDDLVRLKKLTYKDFNDKAPDISECNVDEMYKELDENII